MSGPPRPSDDRLSRGERDRGDEGPAVLGGVGELISDVVGDFATKHVLHVLKAPIDAGLRHIIEQFEEKPFVMMMGRDGSHIRPLSSAEEWRARFSPAREHRVLLFIHGFNSNITNSNPIYWIEELAPRYDAILGYNHPTISRDPIQNAAELLAMVPPDVRLNVDVIAHSRGGLVARSLVELQPVDPKLHIQRIITCGSPHAGTTLADRENWDRLISIGFTAANWVGRATGTGLAFGFVSQGLELLLRAGSQSLFDLPGIEAMDPGSPFLQKLNAPGDVMQHLPYAVVVSDFEPSDTPGQLVQALTSMAAKVFFRVDNDLVVPTNSMSHIDKPYQSLPQERVFSTNVDHFAYFSEHPEIRSFGVNFLLG
jgi:pimeloyl-ACP methyl ester carboxylesterase